LRALVDAHHARAGAEVAIAWKLPRDIVDVCTHHHQSSSTGSQAVTIVRAAEALVRVVEVGPFNGSRPLANVQPADLEPMVSAGIRADRVPALLTELVRQIGLHRDGGAGFESGA